MRFILLLIIGIMLLGISCVFTWCACVNSAFLLINNISAKLYVLFLIMMSSATWSFFIGYTYAMVREYMKKVKSFKKSVMQESKTYRGFGIVEFTDRYGVECSLQESSLASEACIWLGANKIGLKHFKPGQGWKDIKEPDEVFTIEEHYNANTRIYLTREQVKALMPYLKRFVRTGEIL